MGILSGFRNDDNPFGERLKTLRSENMRMTQKEFSAFLKIPQPTLSAYESGKNKPTIDVVINIAKKCNVSIDWLCGIEKKSNISNMGDLISTFFDLYDANEFSFKTELHDRVDWEPDDRYNDDTRNWIRLTFYNNESRYDKNLVYSNDVCEALRAAYLLHNELVNYDCSQDYYDNQKEDYIKKYSDFPLTRLDLSDIPLEERLELRKESLRRRLEEAKKNDL